MRDGDAVKVKFAKGLQPQGVVIYKGGSRSFFNAEYVEKVKSSHKVVLRNPRSSVILHEGDQLGIIGMDDGCTATLVHIHRMLELKLHYGLPRTPGVKRHMSMEYVAGEQ